MPSQLMTKSENKLIYLYFLNEQSMLDFKILIFSDKFFIIFIIILYLYRNLLSYAFM